MDVALEGQAPVLLRPALHVSELREERLRLDRAIGVDRVVLLDLEPPGIGVTGLLADPDRLASLEVWGCDRRRRRECLDPRSEERRVGKEDMATQSASSYSIRSK